MRMQSLASSSHGHTQVMEAEQLMQGLRHVVEEFGQVAVGSDDTRHLHQREVLACQGFDFLSHSSMTKHLLESAVGSSYRRPFGKR